MKRQHNDNNIIVEHLKCKSQTLIQQSTSKTTNKHEKATKLHQMQQQNINKTKKNNQPV
jgi:transposase